MKFIFILIVLFWTNILNADEKSDSQKQHGDTHILPDMSITSIFLENGIFVLAINDQPISTVVLSRNFISEISEFIDKETLERQHDEN